VIYYIKLYVAIYLTESKIDLWKFWIPYGILDVNITGQIVAHKKENMDFSPSIRESV
jgi:hypothetical protein